MFFLNLHCSYSLGFFLYLFSWTLSSRRHHQRVPPNYVLAWADTLSAWNVLCLPPKSPKRTWEMNPFPASPQSTFRLMPEICAKFALCSFVWLASARWPFHVVCSHIYDTCWNCFVCDSEGGSPVKVYYPLWLVVVAKRMGIYLGYQAEKITFLGC